MNKNAKAWAAALRSKRYKQGMGKLCTLSMQGGESKYCCLGVACELYQDATDNSLDTSALSGSDTERKYYNGQSNYLPDKVKDWLGLDTVYGTLESPLIIGDKTVSNLAWGNDNGLTFNQIADIIEKEPPGLFKD